jgi:hypothetical protein
MTDLRSRIEHLERRDLPVGAVLAALSRHRETGKLPSHPRLRELVKRWAWALERIECSMDEDMPKNESP